MMLDNIAAAGFFSVNEQVLMALKISANPLNLLIVAVVGISLVLGKGSKKRTTSLSNHGVNCKAVTSTNWLKIFCATISPMNKPFDFFHFWFSAQAVREASV